MGILCTLAIDATVIVTIDTKPGSFPNSINLGSRGAVPVVIFSTTDFNATGWLRLAPKRRTKKNADRTVDVCV